MRAFLSLAGLVLVACVMPPPPAERATDAARELNLAARFGQMDVALELTAQSLQPTFLAHRAQWGKEIRVLDVELGGFSMASADHAKVEVDYSWSRLTESRLRSTRIAQDWHDAGGGFQLVRERRASGDLGLFGEEVPAGPTGSPKDVQFATKVIR